MNHIYLENDIFRLTVGEDCAAKSLLVKTSGEELLAEGADVPLFSGTQERPYNTEIKLIHMNKQTTFPANRVRMEDGKLILGFDITPLEAVPDVKIAPRYITFTLKEFIVHPEDNPGLVMDTLTYFSSAFARFPSRKRRTSVSGSTPRRIKRPPSACLQPPRTLSPTRENAAAIAY